MQGIGTQMSQEEARAELRCYSEEISRCSERKSHCSAYNLDNNKIEPALILVAAHKHGVDTPDSLEILRKEKKRKEPLFMGRQPREETYREK